MIYYPIVVILFVLNFLVDAEPKFSEYPTVISLVLIAVMMLFGIETVDE